MHKNPQFGDIISDSLNIMFLQNELVSSFSVADQQISRIISNPLGVSRLYLPLKNVTSSIDGV